MSGKYDEFVIQALNHLGKQLIADFSKADFSYADHLEITSTQMAGTVQRVNQTLAEGERLQQQNISNVIRTVFNKYSGLPDVFGLYGAFSYDFVRLFEDLPDQHSHDHTPDFHLYMPDLVFFYDHIKE